MIMGVGTLFYRCILCGSVVSKWDLEEHQGCGKCGHRRLRPSNLSIWEKAVQIFKHPMVWRWNA
jgi:DNA-directed RNA polymerase subunit RPC12/RpoP